METLKEMFEETLKDVYFAENAIIKALPKMAKKAQSEDLKAAFEERPHSHPEDRHIVVLKGTWYTGTGEDFDMNKTIPLKAGSYMKHPAKAVHFDGAKDEEVIVQITGIGPGTTTLVKP